MQAIRLFFLILSMVCLLLMTVGLFTPSLLLWWEAVQNRRKVIKVYGSAALLSYVVYWVLYLLP